MTERSRDPTEPSEFRDGGRADSTAPHRSRTLSTLPGWGPAPVCWFWTIGSKGVGAGEGPSRVGGAGWTTMSGAAAYHVRYGLSLMCYVLRDEQASSECTGLVWHPRMDKGLSPWSA